MKKLIFAAIVLAIIVFGLIMSINNEKEVESVEVDEVILLIKQKKDTMIGNESLRKLSSWQYECLVLKDSISVDGACMSRKEFVLLRDSVKDYKVILMTDEEIERLKSKGR